MNPIKNVKSIESLNTFLENTSVVIGRFGGRKVKYQEKSLTLNDIYKKIGELSKACISKDSKIITSIVAKVNALEKTPLQPKKSLKLATKIREFFENTTIGKRKKAEILNNLKGETPLNSKETSLKSAKEKLEKIKNQLEKKWNELGELKFGQNNQVKRLQLEKKKCDCRVDKLTSLVLDEKIQQLSKDKGFIEEGSKILFSPSLDPIDFFIFIETQTKKTFSKEKLGAEDLIPTYEGFFHGLKHQNSTTSAAILKQISLLKEKESGKNDAHIYAMNVATDKVTGFKK